MTFRRLLFLFCLSIAVAWFVSTYQDSPGYMDADYYYATGLRIVQGFGFSEPLLWNYMDNPVGLPHPSHAYWMPLTSMVAALGIFFAGSHRFASAQVVFVILTGFIPIITSTLSYALNRDKAMATWSGLLSIFSGFYLAFLPTTDTFVIYMLLGGGFFLVLIKMDDLKYRSLLLGILTGLMHLARADGLLWFFIALIIAISNYRNATKKTVLLVVSTCAGYGLIMLPWMLRNQFTFGTLLAPGGTRALWFISYDDLYSYPASAISFSRWWATGLSEIIRARIWALGQNLQTALAVQGEIFLAPFIILGAWRFRRNAIVRWGVLVWLLTLAVMTIPFPFAGARGGFFHSGAALQSLMWALVPGGLGSFLEWGKNSRGWNREHAARFFRVSVVGFAVLLSLYRGYERIIGVSEASPIWNRPSEQYARMDDWLQASGASSDAVVMVNNSPGYFATTARPSIVIPNGDIETLLMVADRYQADYLVLEFHHPRGLDQLYKEPVDQPGLRHLWSDGDTHIFEINISP